MSSKSVDQQVIFKEASGLNGDWAPSASLEILRQRAELLQSIRGFFAQRNVLEVTTPLISPRANPDPALEPIRATIPGGGYLRGSAEFAMKRLLAAGSGDIYELGPVFRAAESGKTHSTEFTMLEWYRQHWDYHQLISEVSALVREVAPGAFTAWPEQILSYAEMFEKYAGINPHSATESDFKSCCDAENLQASRMSRNDWLDLVVTTVIQPSLPAGTFTFVHDYPASQAALARIRPGSPALAERFELYLGQLELANGYQELTDPAEQLRRFESENTQRRQLGLRELPLDNLLLAALEHGLPECAGVALGVDRLLMAIVKAGNISEVLAFAAGN